MRKRWAILLRFALFWLGLQLFLRTIFLLYQKGGGLSCGLKKSILACWYALPMDLSLMGYVFLPLLLLWALSLLITTLQQKRRHAHKIQIPYERRFVLFFSFLISFLCILIAVTDLEIYRNWHTHLDLTPLLYLDHPSESLSSTPWLLITLLLLLIALLALASYYLHTRWIWRKDTRLSPPRWYMPLALLLVALLQILPIRGGIDVATMNVSRVAFSADAYANHVAINPAWNFMHELLQAQYAHTNYQPFLAKNEVNERFNALTTRDSVFPHFLRTQHPNIILLLMESQSAKFSKLLGQDSCMPNFDSLAAHGILFSRVYAASTRSDKGFVATLAGYPAQGKKSIIKFPRKLEQLAFFPNVLDSVGYQSTAFYYGGNSDFMNFKTCAYLAGFRRVVDQSNFPSQLRGSKWGVHDQYVYSRLLTECDSAKAPFCKMFFTLSNHEPFDLPNQPPNYTDSEEMRMRRTARYADSCLGSFVREASQRPWWDSTLMIILADHGHRWPGNSGNEDPRRYHIPMLWLGGALKPDSDTVITTITSQYDLPALLLAQLDLNSSQFPFSQNTLVRSSSPDHPHGVMVIYNDGFGWFTDSASFIYDFDADRLLYQTPQLPETIQHDGEAFFQQHHTHYRNL